MSVHVQTNTGRRPVHEAMNIPVENVSFLGEASAPIRQKAVLSGNTTRMPHQTEVNGTMSIRSHGIISAKTPAGIIRTIRLFR